MKKILLLLFCAVPAMAVTPALIQFSSLGNPNSNPKTITFGTSFTTGDRIIVRLNIEPPSAMTVTSITDDAGNKYQEVSGSYLYDAPFGVFVDLWYSNTTTFSSGSVVTVNFSGTPNGGQLFASEYSGLSISSNPVEDGEVLFSPSFGNPTLGPVLTVTSTSSLCISSVIKDVSNPTGVTSPWIVTAPVVGAQNLDLIAPGSTGTFQAVYNPSQTDSYMATGGCFFPFTNPIPAPPPLPWSVKMQGNVKIRGKATIL